MSKKKKSKRPSLQFSKKVSVSVTIFWMIFRLFELLCALWQPAIAEALVKLVSGVDGVMMVNLGFYCGNSVAEKAILAWMDSKTMQGDEESETIEYAIKNETSLDEAELMTQDQQIEDEPCDGGEEDGNDSCG